MTTTRGSARSARTSAAASRPADVLDQVVKVAGLTGDALTGRLPSRLDGAVDLAAHVVRPDL